MCTIDADGVRHALLPGVNGTVRRQDMPPVYRANVAIYVNDAGEIDLDTSFNDNEVGFVMSAGRSVDIDDLEDFDHAERALQAGYGDCLLGVNPSQIDKRRVPGDFRGLFIRRSASVQERRTHQCVY